MYIKEITGRGTSSTETFVIAPPANAEALGQLGVLVDMENLPEGLHYLGALIAGAVKREYYADPSKSAQQRFAKALRATNETLAREAQSGNDQWIGALHAVVIAHTKEMLLLASTGGCAAYLIRGMQVTTIPLESGEGSRPFGTLTVGKIASGDEIISSSRRILTAANAEETLARDPLRLVKRIQQTENAACLHIAGEATAHTRSRRAFRFAHLPLPAMPRVKLPALPRLPRRLPRLSLPQLQVPSSFRVVIGGTRRFATFLARLPAETMVRTRSVQKRPALFIIAIAMVALGLFGILRSDTSFVRDEPSLALERAQKALEESETLVILGNTQAAIAVLTEGIALLQNAEGAPQPETAALFRELRERRSSLSGTTDVAAEELLNFKGFPLALNPEHIAVVPRAENGGLGIAVAGSNNATVWLNDAFANGEGTLLFLPPPLRRGVTALEATPHDGLFLVTTQDGLAVVRHDTREALGVLARSETTPVRRLARGSTDIFGLVPAARTVIAFTVAEDGTLNEHPGLRSDDPLFGSARDIAAHGKTVFVLLDDNTFLQYRAGRRLGRFRIEGFEWTGEAQAFAALPDARLLILDTLNGRLLLTETNGDIIQQLANEVLSQGLDVALSPDGTAAYVLTKDAILRIDIPS